MTHELEPTKGALRSTPTSSESGSRGIRKGIDRVVGRDDSIHCRATEALTSLLDRYKRSSRHIEVDFRALVTWVRLGDQLTHQLHPYPAKLLPHIASLFVRLAGSPSKQIVLDPFCGSGTVALEASVGGYVPVVADINPFALLLSKVKTTPYDPEQLRRTVQQVLRKAATIRIGPSVQIVNGDLWYALARRSELEILLSAVNEVDDTDARDFMRICFSATARRLSLADPRISVPVRMRTKRGLSRQSNRKIRERLAWLSSTNALAVFAGVCENNIERIEETNALYPDRTPARVIGTDARNILAQQEPLLAPSSVDLIVTSPPYGSAQKYIRASSLALNWLGLATPEELTGLEDQCIGREHVPARNGGTKELPGYEGLLERIGKKNLVRERITRFYMMEMRNALSQMAQALRPQGRIAIVIGNNQVCGEVLRNDRFVTKELEEQGLRVELRVVDHIKSRGLMTKRNKTASVISRESVIVLRK